MLTQKGVVSTSNSKCAKAYKIMVQCSQRAEPSVQRSNCQTCLSRCFFGHLASEANPKNRRFFGALPETLRKSWYNVDTEGRCVNF